ncbi:hypothetical protein STRIP9103_02398 [Streptomyces ipomoeae 91-03]|uniref:Uncharacterized protein n=1 Tax=Streptomyces ipomoeae 91-03 TaxID=698759 RepID=L1L9B8_9ACTN|nr:hypothetical protein STRIP9103_02398 [Streptomyces ipomoeae 91-03]
MLLAGQVLLHQYLDDHPDHDRAGRDVRAVTPRHDHGQPDHGRGGPGVHDPPVRGGQPQQGELRAERDAHARVQGAGQRGPVRDRRGPPPPETDLRDPEHQHDLREGAPHGQMQRRYEEGERGAQQREPERVLGAHGPDVLDEPVAPRLGVEKMQDDGQTDGPESQRDRPQPSPDEDRPYDAVQRPPFRPGPTDDTLPDGPPHTHALIGESSSPAVSHVEDRPEQREVERDPRDLDLRSPHTRELKAGRSP